MSDLNKEVVFLILQFLQELNFKDAVHKVEQESGVFFNMKYFEEIVNNGKWDDVESYLSGFTTVNHNRSSINMFFEIRKQKFLESLDNRDHAKAVEILVKELKVFLKFKSDFDGLFKQMTQLLTLENIREVKQLSEYVDAKWARSVLFKHLKKTIEKNPTFHDKLQFPSLPNSVLRTLIGQSSHWPNPYMKTLFVGHNCGQDGARAPSPATYTLAGATLEAGGLSGVHGPCQPAQASLLPSLAGWIANPSPVSYPTVSLGPIGLTDTNRAAILDHPQTPLINNLAMEYQTAESERVLKRSRSLRILDEVNNLPINILPVTDTNQNHAMSLHSSDDLPMTVLMDLNQGSAVKSMDFHPVQQFLLLVGTNIGDIMIWGVVSRERLAFRNFEVWDLGACSMALQISLANEYTASINRVLWSPKGAVFGVAYSKNIVQIYSFNGVEGLRNHLEIDAHVGNVNDIAFSIPNKKLCVITCGEDKAIKVWDAITGSRQHTFEGHEAPVSSVCPNHRENSQWILSASIDGKIKAWVYDKSVSIADFESPSHTCLKMAYSVDGTRLISCGTSKEGDLCIVELNETQGYFKKKYQGFGKRSEGVVQFDTTEKFLAAGDEFVVKYWDMDIVDLWRTTDAEGGLPASPCIRFNKEGTLLAVSTNGNGIKILANADGLWILPILEATAKKGDIIPKVADESKENSKIRKLAEINEPSQCRCLRLPDNLSILRVSRLIYTNSGVSILALVSNGVHKLWKWQKNNENLTAKATASVPPKLLRPSSGILMTNDISDINPEDAVPCFALSKNDYYLISASGGKTSLFNMLKFKVITTLNSPPPAATFIAFHPQDNNIIAIGMEDSLIHIFNVKCEEAKIKLGGHQKRITGLAFSQVLDVLVSSGADAQLFVWSVDQWKKLAKKVVQVKTTQAPVPLGETRVQFHKDQIHLLAIHEKQITIYKAPELELIDMWIPRESSDLVTDATYSCDCQSIYASLRDGSVSVVNAKTLILMCRISPTAYLPSNPSLMVYPLVIAAHPSEPNQFALGLTDGGVYILEPLESGGKWVNSVTGGRLPISG